MEEGVEREVGAVCKIEAFVAPAYLFMGCGRFHAGRLEWVEANADRRLCHKALFQTGETFVAHQPARVGSECFGKLHNDCKSRKIILYIGGKPVIFKKKCRYFATNVRHLVSKQ